MITIFRHLRQRLLTENKFSKYFLYAIGEIILVVIGILIALQINNWNENRKILGIEQKILNTLKTEMTGNHEQLTNYIAGNKASIDACLACISYFDKDISTLSETQLDRYLWDIDLLETFDPRQGTLNSLIASGQINYIRNENLKTHLSYFQDEVNDLKEEEQGVQRLLDDRFWPISDKYVSTSKRSKPHYEVFPEGSIDSDYQAFFKNQELENIISNILVWRYDMLGEQTQLLQSIKTMLTIMDEEIVK